MFEIKPLKSARDGIHKTEAQKKFILPPKQKHKRNLYYLHLELVLLLVELVQVKLLLLLIY
jgi:hypothetical protein